MYRHHSQDQQLRRTGHAGHTRLLSEGGSSLAGNPRATCVISFPANQASTSESHHTFHRSATGAPAMFALPGNAIFSVTAEHAPQLDEGLLPAVLCTRFAQQAGPLTDEARIEVLQAGTVWAIHDRDKSYRVRRCAGALSVFPHAR